jgi:hypothetical protein
VNRIDFAPGVVARLCAVSDCSKLLDLRGRSVTPSIRRKALGNIPALAKCLTFLESLPRTKLEQTEAACPNFWRRLFTHVSEGVNAVVFHLV